MNLPTTLSYYGSILLKMLGIIFIPKESFPPFDMTLDSQTIRTYYFHLHERSEHLTTILRTS